MAIPDESGPDGTTCTPHPPSEDAVSSGTSVSSPDANAQSARNLRSRREAALPSTLTEDPRHVNATEPSTTRISLRQRLSALSENVERNQPWKVACLTPARLSSRRPGVLPNPRVPVMMRTSTPSPALEHSRSLRDGSSGSLLVSMCMLRRAETMASLQSSHASEAFQRRRTLLPDVYTSEPALDNTLDSLRPSSGGSSGAPDRNPLSEASFREPHRLTNSVQPNNR